MALRTRPRSIFVIVAALLFVAMLAPTAIAKKPVKVSPAAMTVASIESLGIVTFETGYMFDDTEVGGLSGIAYDKSKDVYYALSDDRSQIDPARFYTVTIDFSDGSLDEGDVTFLDVTFLRDANRELFAPFSIDPEGIDIVGGRLFISTEGDSDSDPVIDPFVNRFNKRGKQTKAFPVPAKFLPDGFETYGVSDNLGFEGLTATPNGKHLFAATEASLDQDGGPATLTDGTMARFLEYTTNGKVMREFVYYVDPIPFDSSPPGIFADNGLSDVQAIDNAGTFLAMERSFAVGVGNTIRLFETSIAGATDVSGIDTLTGTETLMTKHLVADFEADLGLDPDNLEALEFGPMLPDGRYSLIVASDNNFNPGQTTQFIVLAVELEPAD
jgi:3-phytase/alkaline phosphatase D